MSLLTMAPEIREMIFEAFVVDAIESCTRTADRLKMTLKITHMYALYDIQTLSPLTLQQMQDDTYCRLRLSSLLVVDPSPLARGCSPILSRARSRTDESRPPCILGSTSGGDE